MARDGLLNASVLIFPHYRRNHFKHPSGCCPQRRAALKRGIDAVGIVVIDLDYLLSNNAVGKFAVTEVTQVFKVRIILA